MNRQAFEENLRELLAAEGPLCAWKRISAPGAETFRMIAEFADAAMALRAVARCGDKTNCDVSITFELC